MMETEDDGNKKVDAMVVQSLNDFKYNCELLETALGNGACGARATCQCGALVFALPCLVCRAGRLPRCAERAVG